MGGYQFLNRYVAIFLTDNVGDADNICHLLVTISAIFSIFTLSPNAQIQSTFVVFKKIS